MEKRLLVLGAGGHGKVVREVALSMKENGHYVYEDVDFLDDYAQNAIGKIEDMKNFRCRYDKIFCSIGNNNLRKELSEKAEEMGYKLPVLIHPTAYVSPTAKLEKGVIVEPKAIVNANTIVRKGSIISVGSILDHDVTIEDYVHINAGAICKAGTVIRSQRKIEVGEIVEK